MYRKKRHTLFKALMVTLPALYYRKASLVDPLHAKKQVPTNKVNPG